MTSWLYTLRRQSRKLWIRTAIIALFSFIAIVSAPLVSWLLPTAFVDLVDREAVQRLLSILSNSMLAVTTFSVATMVSAHLAADQAASPRAHRILRQDGRTQTALATFVGTFVYSIVTTILLQMQMITGAALGVAYLVTCLVLLIVIVTILRWIQRLAELGSVESTTRTAEKGARQTLDDRARRPYLGGRSFTIVDDLPDMGHTIAAIEGGYLRVIDTSGLANVAGDIGADFYVTARPGDWIGPGDTLGWVTVETMDEDLEEKLRSQFVVGETRSLDQDASFGLSVLTEIGERALSPGINDPRTAIDVTARLLSMLLLWEGESAEDEVEFPNVYVLPIDTKDLVRTAFEPIARDGKGFVEVQMQVQTALRRLSDHRDPGVAEAAVETSRRALAYAELTLALEEDREAVRRVAPATEAASARLQPPEGQVGVSMDNPSETT